jgi:hypothetical protein
VDGVQSFAWIPLLRAAELGACPPLLLLLLLLLLQARPEPRAAVLKPTEPSLMYVQGVVNSRFWERDRQRMCSTCYSPAGVSCLSNPRMCKFHWLSANPYCQPQMAWITLVCLFLCLLLPEKPRPTG